MGKLRLELAMTFYVYQALLTWLRLAERGGSD